MARTTGSPTPNWFLLSFGKCEGARTNAVPYHLQPHVHQAALEEMHRPTPVPRTWAMWRNMQVLLSQHSNCKGMPTCFNKVNKI